jgi:acyl-CoA thioester hydrolase
MPFSHQIRVSYQDVDMQRHVYFPRYLEYADLAMVEFLRHLGWVYEELIEIGFDPVVGRLELDYGRPARFDELITVTVVPTRIGNASFALEYEIQGSDGADVAKVVISYVNFDAEERVTRPIPDSVRPKLESALR